MDRERYTRDVALADMGWRLAAPGIRARRRQCDIFVTPDAGDAGWDGPAIETERTRWTPKADVGARPALAVVLLASVSDFARQVPWREFGVPARRMAGLFAVAATGFGLVMLNARPGIPERAHSHHAREEIIAAIAPAPETPVDERAGGNKAEAVTAGSGSSVAENAVARAAPANPQAAQLASTASDSDADTTPVSPTGAAGASVPVADPSAGGTAETAAVHSQWGASDPGDTAASGSARAIRANTPAPQPLPQRIAAVALAPVETLTEAEAPRGALDTMPAQTERPHAVSPARGDAQANAPVVADAVPHGARLPGRHSKPMPVLAAALPVWTPMPAGKPARMARAAAPASRPALQANRPTMAGWHETARPAPVLLVRAMAKRPVEHRMAAADFQLPRWLTQPKPAAPRVLIMSPQPHMLQAPIVAQASPAHVIQAAALPPRSPAPHQVARPQYRAPVYANNDGRQAGAPAYYGYGGYYPQAYYPRPYPQGYYAN